MTSIKELVLFGLIYFTMTLFDVSGMPGALLAGNSCPEKTFPILASGHPSSGAQISGERPTTQGDMQAKFSSVVERFVADSSARSGGAFKIQDDVLGRDWYLKLVRIHKDKIVHLADNRYFACADFADISGQESLDVDFYVAVVPTQQVTNVVIHKVNTSPRFNYDSKGERVAVVNLQESEVLPSKGGRVLEVGDLAPNFSLPRLTGEIISLSTHINQPVLLWFTNLCGGCQAVIPDVVKINRDYSRKGVSVLAISLLGSDTATVNEVVQKQKTTFPFLIDPEGGVYEQYGGVKLPPGSCPANPQLFILDHGKVAYAAHFPGASTDELRIVLDRLTDARKPAPSEHPSEHPGGSSDH